MGSGTVDVSRVRADLLAEQDSLDAVVSTMNVEQWEAPTPSDGWVVADQIAHLAYFDEAATAAIVDPDRFTAMRDELAGAALSNDPDAVDTLTLARFKALGPEGLLAAWRANRRMLAEAAAGLVDGDRIEWYGPSMGAKSFLTARLMEAWAHGEDVAEAVGQVRHPTDRLAHIARLGFITRAWSYLVRGLEPPDSPVRVELAAPSGDVWDFGPGDAEQSVIGPALDFCLVVTQRRHVDDTTLVTDGDDARDWMVRAQAFAGGPTQGPPPAGGPPR